MADGGSKVTGYIVEFKEVNKEEEEKKAQRRLLLSDVEEEREPKSEESWQKVKNPKNILSTQATVLLLEPPVDDKHIKC